MNKFALAAITASAFGAAALGLAGTAAAATTGGGDAATTVSNLQAAGYVVQINGNVSGPLSECTATDVHTTGGLFGTAYVDVACTTPNNS